MLEAYENTRWQAEPKTLPRGHQKPWRALRTAPAQGYEAFVDDAGARPGRRMLDMTGPPVWW